jgi:hypothetical protein
MEISMNIDEIEKVRIGDEISLKFEVFGTEWISHLFNAVLLGWLTK